MNIPFFDLGPAHRQIEPQLDAAWSLVKRRGQFILGEQVDEFERRFAAYCDAEHAIGVGNGLDAIALILQALSIGPGDEVLVPASGFIATWLAVAKVGAHPVPVECEEQTSNISPEAARRALTSRTKAIVPVHLFGRPAELEPLCRIAEDAGIFLVEDAAQAHGATYQGKRIGTFGIASAFSFYPTKNLGAMGDGGAIVTNDRGLDGNIRLLRNYGSRVKYQHEIAGINSRLDELQAALLSAKLEHLNAWNAERRRIAAAYNAALGPVADLHITPPADHLESVWHLYTIRSPRRDALAAALSQHGVQTMIHYPVPPHLQPAFAHLRFETGSFPVSERISAEILSLPLWPGMTAEQINYVKDAVVELSSSSTSVSTARKR